MNIQYEKANDLITLTHKKKKRFLLFCVGDALPVTSTIA